MPREVWSVEIQADITAALSQLQALRAQISGLGAGTAAIRPTFDASGVQQGVNTMGNALTKGRARATTFIGGIQQDFGNFGRIFASRLAFTFATAVQRFIIGSLMLIPKAMAGAISAGAKFEDAIRRTATVAAGGFGDIEGAMDKLGTTAREVGATTTFTAVEVASAMFELVSVGLSIVETQDAIVASSQLAVAVQTDLATAIDITTQIMKAFGLNASELQDIGDKLTFAIDNTTLNVSRLQAALRFAAPAAGALGIEFDDMLTVVAKFVDVTKQGGIAGRAFRFMISALADPTEKAAGRLGELGLTVEDVNPQMHSLTDIMKLFARTSMDGGDALAIFGKRAGGTVAGAIDDIRLGLAAGVDELEKFKEGLTNAARLDLAEKQAKEFMTTLVSKWKIFVSKITELGLQIFDAIGPFVIGAMTALNKLMDGLIAIAPQLKTFAAVLATIVAIGFTKFLIGATAQMWKFGAATIAANRASKGFAIAGFAQKRAMVEAARGAGMAAGNMTRMSIVASKIVPILKMLAGKTVILAIIAGLIEWARRSWLIGQTFTLLRYVIEDIIMAVANWFGAFTTLAEVWETVTTFVSNFINFGLDAIFWAIGKSVAWVANKLAGFARVIPGLGDVADGLEQVATWADDSAEAIVTAAMAKDLEIKQAKKMKEAVNSLNEALKIQVDTLDDFKEKETAVVTAWENMAAAGETQEDALELLAPALRDLFLRSEELGAEYSDNLVPIMADAVEKFGWLSKEALEAAARMVAMKEAFSNLFGSTKEEGVESLYEFIDALIVAGETSDKLGTEQLEVARKALDELQAAAVLGGYAMDNDFRLAMLDAEGILSDMSPQFFRLGENVDYLTENLKLLPDAVKSSGKMIMTFQQVSDAIENVRLHLEETQSLIEQGIAPPGAMKDVKDHLLEMAELVARSGDETEKTKEQFIAIAKALGFAVQEGESFEEFAKRVAESGKEAKSEWEMFFKQVETGIAKAVGDIIVKGKGLVDSLGAMFKGLFGKTLVQGFGSFMGAFSDAREAGDGMMASLSSGIEKFREQLDGKMNASIMGVGAAMGGWGEIGMGAMSAISNFASGDWVAGIMATIGTVIGALRNLFGTSAGKELKKLGLAVSDELTKKIEESKDALGDYGAAIRANLVDIIKEEGIKSVADLTKFIGLMNGSLGDLDSGLITSGTAITQMSDAMSEMWEGVRDLNSPEGFQGLISTLIDVTNRVGQTGASAVTSTEATRLLEEQFDSLVDTATQFGAAGAEGMRAVIEGARSAGLEVEKINNFVLEHSNTIVNSIKDLVGSGLELTAEQVQFAASMMSTAFAEMRASGMTVPDIIESMGDALGALKARAKELGIDLPKSFRLIAGLGPLFKNEVVKPHLDGVQAMTDAFGALIALGIRPTQADIEALSSSTVAAFDVMIEQGAKEKQALLALSPTLEMIRQNAADFGLQIDDNTQSLIDQAVEAGVLGEAQMSTNDVMATGFENVGKAINRLIETMGGVPVALAEFEVGTRHAADSMGDNLSTVGGVIENEVIPGIQQARIAINDLGLDASAQMGLFASAASDAVGEALASFEELEDELVGHSIIPDIAEKGAGFMEEWGDSTAAVVHTVEQDFKGMGANITEGSTSPFGATPGIVSMPAFQAPAGLNESQKAKANEDREIMKKIAAKAAQEISLRIDLGGREMKNFIVETIQNESRNGRAVVDKNAVRETGT